MSKVLFLVLIFVSINSSAVEPVMDQQGMFYFNMTFDIGSSKKMDHDFGFRLDRALVQPGETMSMTQLAANPAVLNLKLNKNGLKAFKVNGVDYSYDVNDTYVYRGAEGGDNGGETAVQPVLEEEPKRKIDIPLGVIIGVLIGTVALVQ